MEAGAGWALVADHERKAVATCAPNFHVVNGTVELQGHQQLLNSLEDADPSAPALKAVKQEEGRPLSFLRLDVGRARAHVRRRGNCLGLRV